MKLVNLAELPEGSVSHDPQLKKKVMVKNGEIPHITGFSQVRIPPNEVVSSHVHQDMHEVFLVNEGEGTMVINKEEFPLKAGTCIVVEPKEVHSLKNTGNGDLVLTYFGVV